MPLPKIPKAKEMFQKSENIFRHGILHVYISTCSFSVA